jgi:hypothetical protein
MFFLMTVASANALERGLPSASASFGRMPSCERRERVS